VAVKAGSADNRSAMSSPSTKLYIHPASEAERNAALRLLLGDDGVVRVDRASQPTFAGECADGLVVACRGETVVGAVWSQRLSPLAAEIWRPRLVPGEPPSTASDLLQAAIGERASQGARLVHLLLKPSEAAALPWIEQAGFALLAELKYLLCPKTAFPKVEPGSNVQFDPVDQSSRDRLVAIVEQTYHQTLDIPEYSTERPAADVLEGYQARGDESDAWYIASDAGQAIGCLLLTDQPADEQFELTYMGLVPEARGRGLGRQLVRYAQWLARQASRERIVLAVDCKNWPALGIYERVGFVRWDERSVWLKTIGRDFHS
jgi:ribosomal protein S18 acetylase RimI-like enzyme